MNKDRCRDCAALVEIKGEWICDEQNKPIDEVEHCPEGLE